MDFCDAERNAVYGQAFKHFMWCQQRLSFVRTYVIVKPVMGEWKDCCFQGTIPAKKPISNKYVAARLTQQPEQDLTDETADFLSVPWRIRTTFRKWNDHQLRLGMKTKRKQFHLNGCPHYFCSDTHHLWSWWLFRARRRQNQMTISNSLLTTNIVQSVRIRPGKLLRVRKKLRTLGNGITMSEY